jgi:hypothetical protein
VGGKHINEFQRHAVREKLMVPFAIGENLVNCKVGENIPKPTLQAFTVIESLQCIIIRKYI